MIRVSKQTAISEDEKWQIEGDVRTMKEAEMIKKDPKRLEKALGLMADEMEAMSMSMEGAARKQFPNTKFNKEGE